MPVIDDSYPIKTRTVVYHKTQAKIRTVNPNEAATIIIANDTKNSEIVIVK